MAERFITQLQREFEPGETLISECIITHKTSTLWKIFHKTEKSSCTQTEINDKVG